MTTALYIYECVRNLWVMFKSSRDQHRIATNAGELIYGSLKRHGSNGMEWNEIEVKLQLQLEIQIEMRRRISISRSSASLEFICLSICLDIDLKLLFISHRDSFEKAKT